MFIFIIIIKKLAVNKTLFSFNTHDELPNHTEELQHQKMLNKSSSCDYLNKLEQINHEIRSFIPPKYSLVENDDKIQHQQHCLIPVIHDEPTSLKHHQSTPPILSNNENSPINGTTPQNPTQNLIETNNQPNYPNLHRDKMYTINGNFSTNHSNNYTLQNKQNFF